MVIDFDKLGGINSGDSTINPRQIFDVLPEKDEKYEEYLRDVQTEVLNKWFNQHRNDKDTVIKMNTGSGKTVVGLLILKSCLNEGKGPAVYVVPDNYLLEQVFEEAKSLGIETTKNVEDPNFLKGDSILLVNLYKLINGKSVFGVEEKKIEIGSIIIDDAHACLDISEDQFSIKIPSHTELYNRVLSLFKESIGNQSPLKLVELESGDPNANVLVPFWTWIDKNDDIIQILHEEKDNQDSYQSLSFGWQLLKDTLHLCNCVIGTDEIEISPKFSPIHKIPSFVNAERRIFMSATISDDSVLVSHFDINSDSLVNAITPNSSNDIGERMILIPQEINPDISDEQLKSFYKRLSTRYNVVVIVPSRYKVPFWEEQADLILYNYNMNSGISKLKEGHVGLVIIVNKYDGIDLPKSACSVLVIDGLPDVRRKIDRIVESALQGSEASLTGKIQKIEQGMGRGIRSKDDYCTVFLMGKSLVSQLYVKGAISKFTPATNRQIELSEQVSKQLRGKTLEEFFGVIRYPLTRDSDWIKTARRALVDVEYNPQMQFNNQVVLERNAYNEAITKNYRGAANILLQAVNKEDNLILRGFLKQKMAEYIHFYDNVESQQTLMSAVKDNTQVTHPIEGITYDRMIPCDLSQAQELVKNIKSKYKSPNKYVLFINSLIENLVFKKGTSNLFEQGINDLAEVLGLKGQRPEKQYNKGPDNLWSVGNSLYLVIECKNGSDAEKISKKDCNQLNGSINWFKEVYDETNTFVPIMIHKSVTFDYSASPHKQIRIMNEELLSKLKSNLKSFSKVIIESCTDVRKVDELLNQYSLKGDNFIEEYTTLYK